MSKRDRRVAARTKATTPPTGRRGEPAPQADDAAQAQDATFAEPMPEPEPADGDAPLAKVIPLGIFDPFAEADKRW